MPRLVNAVTGVIVNVDDATAANLGADWSEPKAGALEPEREPQPPVDNEHVAPGTELFPEPEPVPEPEPEKPARRNTRN